MATKELRRVFWSVAAGALFAATVFVPVYAVDPTGSGPQWSTLTPVPATFSGVEGMSVASTGETIVAALGYDGGDTATTRLYDIASDSWNSGASAPGTSSEGAGVSQDGLVYSIGGRTAGPGSPARNDIWSYDTVTDAWTALTSMPTARAGLAVANIGDQIYAIGGRTATGGPCTGDGTLATVERYNIPFDTWTTVASLPSARSDLAAAAVGGKIYVFGGCDNTGTALNTVNVYNPVTNTWSTATAMPTARAGMYAVASKGGTVYVIGGCTSSCVAPLSTNEAYKVATNTWTAGLLPMTTARAETGAVGHGGRIYIVGGSLPAFGASTNANEVFKP